MTTRDQRFGIGVGEVFAAGWSGFRAQPLPLALGSVATLGVYAAFRVPAQSAVAAGAPIRALVLDLLGLLGAAVAALPWYSYSLDAARGEPVNLREPLAAPARIAQQLSASFWFWAGVLLGLRYLYGLPSLLVVLFYAFYGFVVADGAATSGLRALGTSVRIGQGKRVGLFALGALFLVFNLAGAIALGFGTDPVNYALAFVGVVVTSCITMVAGACLYDVLRATEE